MNCVIFDLDGLLFDCRHRVPLIEGDDPNWDAFYLACTDDLPIKSSVEIYHALMDAKFKIVVSTGRSEICRGETTYAFEKNSISLPHHLLMRPEKDYCKDVELKQRHIEFMHQIDLNPVMAFDDRPGCVNLFWQNGIPCYHLESDKIARAVETAENKG